MSPRPARIATIFAASLAVLAAASAAAQTLYKLIDKNGKVTYSEEAPKNFDGKVIRLDIDPNANRATLPKYEKGAEPARTRTPAGTAKQGAPDLDALRKRVDERKAALENAQNNPSDDDVQWLGNAGGAGVRRVPTADYQRRLAELERSLKEAEHELEQAEKGGH